MEHVREFQCFIEWRTDHGEHGGEKKLGGFVRVETVTTFISAWNVPFPYSSVFFYDALGVFRERLLKENLQKKKIICLKKRQEILFYLY